MQKQMYTYFIFCVVLLGSFLNTGAQNIDSLLGIFKQADPQEKIYIHFDKNYYNPGETIWFKAYIFDGLEHAVSAKNFYAELTDEAGNVMSRVTAPVGESSAAGSIILSANLTKNLLYFRASTAAMLNGDTNFLYVKPIRILTSAKNIKIKQPAVSISFLPEGGDMIADISSVLAFKVTDANGLPVNAKGYIKESNGAKAGDFATVHDGMGWFRIEPKQGMAYTAVWKDAYGKEYNTLLPAVKPQGIALQILDAADGKKFILQRSDSINEDAKHLRIIAYMNQQLVYYAKINFSSSTSTSGIIPVKQLPSGILQVTVFDNNFKPVAERVSFINNHDYEFDADAWIPVFNKDKRGLNTLEVQVSDTFRTNLSLSVTDADLNVPPSPNEDNIISHLLLTADLHGKIANPYYYFFSTADSAVAYLDLVMLTNGWRRYNWDKVFAGKPPAATVKESNYISINGKLIGMQSGHFSPDTRLSGILQTKDSVRNFLSLPVDRKGEVKSEGYIFYDFAKLYFQFNDKKLIFDKSLLHVDNGLVHSPDKLLLDDENKKTGLEIDTNLIAKNLKNASDEMRVAIQRARREKEQVLKEVVVTGRVKSNEQKMDEKYASGLFSGGDSRNFDLTNDPFASSSQSIFQYLQGKVAGLQINTAGNPPSMTWRGGTPVFYLDEVQTDASFMQNLNMNDVAYVKVFSPGAVGVISSSGGGAIAVYTKKGGDRTNNDKSKGLDYVQVTGYTPVKEFYSPNYATASLLNDLPDLRTTLYWAPYIILDKNRKRVKIQFYNNDVTHRFRVVMEGINANDKLVRVEKVIE
jgi:hypothetical protein